MKFFLGWLVVFIVWVGGSFVIHAHLLHADYQSLPNLFRTLEEAHSHYPFLFLADAIFAGAFTWIYSRGVSSAPWVGQGFRFGIAVTLLTMVPMYLIYYVVQPMPGTLVVRQILFTSILVILLGILVAAVYQEKPSTA